jgi:hypothetical protein
VSTISIVLLCDGTSDFCICHPIEWIIGNRFDSLTFRIVQAHTLVPARGALDQRLKKAFEDYGADIIVCHRDAERATFVDRLREVEQAVHAADLDIPVVAAIPVRMTEAWLLFDEGALRAAANNARGTTQLVMPRMDRIEQHPDPKELLFENFKIANGLAANRNRRFDVHRARHRLAELIDDFSPLRQLGAFRHFEESLIAAVEHARQ